MRFALVDSSRTEAQPGLKGICPACNQPVIAKCGTFRVPHWAHTNTKNCDSWWEPETAWHRNWKNQFPTAWQESILIDQQTGEKHIADVRTGNDLVIEFQHSPIKQHERYARENFYKNMVWVVDGTRLEKDYVRFVRGQTYFQFKDIGIFNVVLPEKCFPATWLESSVPIIFDFQGVEPIEDPLGLRGKLHCLFPVRIGGCARVETLSRKAFIEDAINGRFTTRVTPKIETTAKIKPALKEETIMQQPSNTKPVLKIRFPPSRNRRF
jgi:competence protein CoiA